MRKTFCREADRVPTDSERTCSCNTCRIGLATKSWVFSCLPTLAPTGTPNSNSSLAPSAASTDRAAEQLRKQELHHLARELHDELGQHLTGMHYAVEALRFSGWPSPKQAEEVALDLEAAARPDHGHRSPDRRQPASDVLGQRLSLPALRASRPSFWREPASIAVSAFRETCRSSAMCGRPPSSALRRSH